DAGSNPLTPLVALDLLAQVHEDRGLLGPGADDVHLALQHVEQLGQLVEPELPQHAADRRDAHVVGLRPHLLPVAVGVAHRAELVHRERRTALIGVAAGVAPAFDSARRSNPTRVCVNNTGPRDVSLISAAMSSISGNVRTSPTTAT